MNNSDDQKVNFDTEMVLEALEHHEQDLCIIKALLLEQTELLRDLRTDYKECLQLLKKPVKPSKKKGKRKVVTLPTRANIRKPYTAKMELAKENVIYKSLSRATGSVVDLTRWKGRKVGDIETYEKKKKSYPPTTEQLLQFCEAAHGESAQLLLLRPWGESVHLWHRRQPLVSGHQSIHPVRTVTALPLGQLRDLSGSVCRGA